jgi:hypothetical protein
MNTSYLVRASGQEDFYAFAGRRKGLEALVECDNSVSEVRVKISGATVDDSAGREVRQYVGRILLVVAALLAAFGVVQLIRSWGP